MEANELAFEGNERTYYCDVTPALAESWLQHHHFEGQRKIHPERVEAYAEDMRHGLFGASDFHFAVLARTGGDWRPMMNGRHRCAAVLASNCGIRARVHEIPIEKEEDAGVIYSWFDVAGLRSQGEILSAMGTEVSARLLNVTQQACTLLISGFELVPVASGLLVRSSTNLQVKRKVMEEWAPYAQSYLGVVVGQNARMSQILRRQNVMSVGMVTMRHCEEKAVPFWTQLAVNDVRPETPQSLLMDLFMDKKSGAFPAYKWARLVAHAWNYYYEGKAIKVLRVGEAILREPIAIRGTPYDGKQIHAYGFVEGENG